MVEVTQLFLQCTTQVCIYCLLPLNGKTNSHSEYDESTLMYLSIQSIINQIFTAFNNQSLLVSLMFMRYVFSLLLNSLGDNSVGNEGATALADVLRVSQSLKTL